MTKQGNFGFGGQQRSYSFGCFHADSIPNSLVAVGCPAVGCEWIQFQNDPTSTDNSFVGSDRLAVVGFGHALEPGGVTGWIPASNLDLFIHKELDATTYLNYMLIGCDMGSSVAPILGFLRQEDGNWLLQEDGDNIIL